MNFPIHRKCLEKSLLEMEKNETFLRVKKHLTRLNQYLNDNKRVNFSNAFKCVLHSVYFFSGARLIQTFFN